MRWLLPITLLGCSTPAEPLPALDGGVWTSTAAADDTSLGAANASARAADDAGAREVVDYLCFRIDRDSGIEELVPTIAPTLALVTHRWGRAILVHDDCDSVVTVGDVRKQDGEPAPARAIHSETSDGFKLSGAFAGGATRIVLDRRHLEEQRIIDVADFGCDKGPMLLARILTHEIGHVLRVPHNPSEASAMFEIGLPCRDGWPDARDLGAAVGR